MTDPAPVSSDIGDMAPLIFVVAGEPSGDVLGGRLMAALKRRTGGRVRFAGVGGELMIREGLESLFPQSDLAVMGLFEVLPKLRLLTRRIRKTSKSIQDLHPDAVVTIDSPDFSTRVLRRLNPSSVPLIHFVAPTVWAWRAGRAKIYARLVDHIMVLLPFEPPYFERVGLDATFVGHPVIESGADRGDGPAFRKRHGLSADALVLCVLPGSRRGELKRHLPIFADTVSRLCAAHPSICLVIPTVSHLEAEVAAATQNWQCPVTVVSGDDEKYDAMGASDAALAASGTVALELALAEVPMVIAYRVNPLTGAIINRMAQVKYANLVNLLLDREAIPEFLFGNCRADLLADAVGGLLADPVSRDAQREAARNAMRMLAPAGRAPSDSAAECVLRSLGASVDHP